MPDVWTTNPPKLRNTLQEAGIICGVESRVLKPRDPYWTCIVDSKGWLRDIYIHHVDKILVHPYYITPLVLALGWGILCGLLWGKLFRRRSSAETNSAR